MKCKASTSWAIFSGRGRERVEGPTGKVSQTQITFLPSSLSKLLRHRGPDWNGITCFRNCYLAHERLAINGLLSGAQVEDWKIIDHSIKLVCWGQSVVVHFQPITNINGDTALSVNGEIYNHIVSQTWLQDFDFDFWIKCFLTPGAAPAVGEGLGWEGDLSSGENLLKCSDILFLNRSIFYLW